MTTAYNKYNDENLLPIDITRLLVKVEMCCYHAGIAIFKDWTGGYVHCLSPDNIYYYTDFRITERKLEYWNIANERWQPVHKHQSDIIVLQLAEIALVEAIEENDKI